MPSGWKGPLFVSDGGTDWFTILPPEVGLLRGYSFLLDARQEALRIPGPEGRARALAIDLVLKEVQTAVDAAAAATAVEAQKLVVGFIKATQVRPDPPGKAPGRRLQENIVCRPLKFSAPGGAVGIGEISALDRVADAQGRAYWRAQEFGSSHLVGRMLIGAFEPGGAAPSSADFRKHPLFVVRQNEGYGTVIQRPIPERAFLREGAVAAEAFRQRALGRAVSPAIPELRLIQSGNHPKLKATRAFVRGRRLP